MSEVELIDVSLRDGNQSTWSATGLNTPQVLEIAPVMDRVGFRALDYSSSTAMGVAVRVHRQDPWQRLRLTRRLMPDTRLQFISTGMRFISWERAHPDVMQLVYDRLVVNGMDRFVVLDPTLDGDAMLEAARMVKQAGGTEVVAALTYTVSDFHDDVFYADLATTLARSPHIDRFYLKDPAGILTPDRARSLIPAVATRIGETPLELHSHATIGLSQHTYLTAPDLGVSALHVGCGPLGDGTSLPDAQRTVTHLREMGCKVDIDDRMLALVADYFHRLAQAEGLPSGEPRPYDPSFLRHQIAGGVMTTTRRQLAEIGLEHRFDEVIAETERVRAELGYPIMVTPFPQMVCSQAMANVVESNRYTTVPDQVIRYVLGTFGRPTGPVDPDVRDRIMSRPRAKELAAEPPPPSPAELRRRFGAGIEDEELLLRATMPEEQVDAMLSAGPPATRFDPDLFGVKRLLRELDGRPPFSTLVVEKPDFRLELHRAGT